MHTSSVTVFIRRLCNSVFITQVTGLCRQLSIVVAWLASSQVVMLRCYGLWREECMQCVGWIVQNLAEQLVVGLIQQQITCLELSFYFLLLVTFYVATVLSSDEHYATKSSLAFLAMYLLFQRFNNQVSWGYQVKEHDVGSGYGSNM